MNKKEFFVYERRLHAIVEGAIEALYRLKEYNRELSLLIDLEGKIEFVEPSGNRVKMKPANFGNKQSIELDTYGTFETMQFDDNMAGVIFRMWDACVPLVKEMKTYCPEVHRVVASAVNVPKLRSATVYLLSYDKDDTAIIVTPFRANSKLDKVHRQMYRKFYRIPKYFINNKLESELKIRKTLLGWDFTGKDLSEPELVAYASSVLARYWGIY